MQKGTTYMKSSSMAKIVYIKHIGMKTRREKRTSSTHTHIHTWRLRNKDGYTHGGYAATIQRQLQQSMAVTKTVNGGYAGNTAYHGDLEFLRNASVPSIALRTEIGRLWFKLELRVEG